MRAVTGGPADSEADLLFAGRFAPSLRLRGRVCPPRPSMSALGQKRTSGHDQSMSALPPKADIADPPIRIYFQKAGRVFQNDRGMNAN